jgi:hypothetical protein
VRIGQAAALRCFWHPQIMPDLSSCQTYIKPYESRLLRLIDTPLLPTLKPEEPIILGTGRAGFICGMAARTLPRMAEDGSVRGVLQDAV